MPDDVERMWRGLETATSDRDLHAWFRDQAEARGMAVTEEPDGHRLAWWRPEPDAAAGGVLAGSRLGLGPGAGLGVVSGFAAVDLLRSRGVVPERPVGVAALAASGSAPAVPDPASLRSRVSAFVELRVEAGRDLAERGTAVGIAGGSWPRGRWRLEVTGPGGDAADPMEGRADPLLTAAMTVLAVHKQARLAGQRATVGRLEVAPGRSSSVPSAVTAWVDVRAADEAALDALVEAVRAQAVARAERDGTELRLVPEERTPAVELDPGLLAAVVAEHAGGPLPVLPPSPARYDAGVLAAAGVPAAVLLVRHPAGLAEVPAGRAAPPDSLVSVSVLADALAHLSGPDQTTRDGSV